MKRSHKVYQVTVTPSLKKQLMEWATQQGTDMIWLDSNHYPDTFRQYEAILALQPHSFVRKDTPKGAFEALKEYIDQTNDWIFGYLAYDLKNDIELLQSDNYDGLHLPDLYFFQPQKLVLIRENTLTFSYYQPIAHIIEADWAAIQATDILPDTTAQANKSNNIRARISKEDYLQKVTAMKAHIARGDIYEANFCQEFFIENQSIDPKAIYRKLNEISEPPFATFMKLNEHYLLSASPERYLQRIGSTVISQPIKGTAKRSADTATDTLLRHQLQHNAKERSENIMIVDLVRNDLSLCAEKASVQVTELCQPYTFKQVHQLISTIQARVKHNTHPVDIIKMTFPMGSMTGAPKISAMQIIEKLEQTKRSLYSGAVGYFSPTADFDFNVVIRSILYNAQRRYVSFSVGSAITTHSDIEKEYEECLIKAQAMMQVLGCL